LTWRALLSEESEMGIWDHVEELAHRLRRIFFAIAIATMLFTALPSDFGKILRLNFEGYTPLVSSLIGFIQESMLPEGVILIAFNWLDTFSIYIQVSVIMGIITTLPYTSYQLIKFISPALYENEKRTVVVFVGVATILFGVGVLYAWLILLPTTFVMLYRFVYTSRVMPMYSVADFFNIFAMGILGSGLFYMFPIVIWLLIKGDLIDVQILKDNRRQVFVVLLIITSLLPDPTPMTMFLMTVPFYLLYELTIQILSKVYKTNRDVVMRGILASKRLLESIDSEFVETSAETKHS
jgi:sec-independent protein translocase protein TatC